MVYELCWLKFVDNIHVINDVVIDKTTSMWSMQYIAQSHLIITANNFGLTENAGCEHRGQLAGRETAGREIARQEKSIIQ